jgi:hypothetical protein
MVFLRFPEEKVKWSFRYYSRVALESTGSPVTKCIRDFKSEAGDVVNVSM